METLWQDVKYGVRMLARAPGFTAVAVLTLALGIGANTAVFSVVYGVLFRPLPYPEPDRLMQLSWGWSRPDSENFDYSQFRFFAEHSRAFQGLAAFTSVGFNLTAGNQADRVRGLHVSANYFPLLGVEPLLGRTFLPEEQGAQGSYVAILSHELWQRRFGGDPEVVGEAVLLNGKPFTVIGIAPPEFSVWHNADVWAPLALVARTIGSGGNLGVVGRLKPGATREQAQADLDLMTERYFRQFPQVYERFSHYFGAELRLQAYEYRKAIGSSASNYLLLLFGAIGFVLLIACANVAGLLLARAAARAREVAVRTALGASRSRLVRQLLTESVLLAFLGALLGVGLAVAGLQLLAAWGPGNLPRMSDIRLDRWVLGFALVLAVVSGVLFGLAPALQAAKASLHEALKEGFGRASGTLTRSRLGKALVAAQIAISLVLLAGAGLMMRTVANLLTTDPGFNPQSLLAVEFWLAGSRNNSTASVALFYNTLVQEIQSLPGVEAAAVVSAGLPLQRGGNMPMRLEEENPSELFSADYRSITPGYFRTLGIPLRQGRLFAAADREDARAVAIINETFARRYFADRNPMGGRLTIGFHDRTRTIVGVVGDTKSYLNRPPEPTVFMPASQAPYGMTKAFDSWFPTHLLVRTAGQPLRFSHTVRHSMQAVDPQVPIGRMRSMEHVREIAASLQRFLMMLLGLFAALALVLAAVGVYGLMSYSIAQRTREIGVRMALGAQRRDILRLVVRQGVLLTGIGVGLGLAGAFVLTRFLQSMLFNVTRTDPATFAGVSLLLALVALGACYLPARRATRVDPMVALRYE